MKWIFVTVLVFVLFSNWPTNFIIALVVVAIGSIIVLIKVLITKTILNDEESYSSLQSSTGSLQSNTSSINTEIKELLLEHRKLAILFLESFYTEAFNILLKHFSTLFTKYNQNIQEDDYGRIIDKGWSNELNYFIDNILLKELDFSKKVIYPYKQLMILGDVELNVLNIPQKILLKDVKNFKPMLTISFKRSGIELISTNAYIGDIVEKIKKSELTDFLAYIKNTEKLSSIDYEERRRLEKIIDAYITNVSHITKDNLLYKYNFYNFQKTRSDTLANNINLLFNTIKESIEVSHDLTDKNMTPYEFEHRCAGALKELGFSARATKGSGDQGVDVIAEKNGIKLVIQCKLYSNPVGNKAVQEVIAGKQFYNADIGAVVTNAPFTPSAKELAATCNILLINCEELHKLEEHINIISQ